MRNGLRRTLVRIEEPAEGAPDAFGAPVAGWRSMGEAYAEIVPLSTRELEVARQVEPRASHRLTVLFRPGLHHRVRFVIPRPRPAPDRFLRAVGPPIDPDERHRHLVFTVAEGTD